MHPLWHRVSTAVGGVGVSGTSGAGIPPKTSKARLPCVRADRSRPTKTVQPLGVTLDIVDRDREPFYCTNTKWCCAICNSEKGSMTPDEYEVRRQMWNLWTSNNESPGERGMLF